MSEPWLCESLRFTALWNAPRDSSRALSWETVVGVSPERREDQPRQQKTLEVGPVLDGIAALELLLSPRRVDWRLIPAISQTPEQLVEIPNIGRFVDTAKFFAELLFEKTSLSYDADRIAVGAIAIHPARGLQECYTDLARLLPGVQVPENGASELVFQINRPRPSSSLPGTQLNRLSRWSAMSVRSVELVMSDAAQTVRTQSDSLFATRVELDYSSPADRTEPLPAAARLALTRELIDLANESIANGDSP